MKTLFLFFIFSLSCPIAFTHPIDMTAIAQIESSNDPKAVGSSGEIGLYQISPIALKHFNQVHFGKKIKHGRSVNYQGMIYMDDLKNPERALWVANWYMNWLFDRCWTVTDTIIAWNWGIGNWRNWKKHSSTEFSINGVLYPHDNYHKLPKVTQDYLKKYKKLTHEK